jgi:hypothetical protein
MLSDIIMPNEHLLKISNNGQILLSRLLLGLQERAVALKCFAKEPG